MVDSCERSANAGFICIPDYCCCVPDYCCCVPDLFGSVRFGSDFLNRVQLVEVGYGCAPNCFGCEQLDSGIWKVLIAPIQLSLTSTLTDLENMPFSTLKRCPLLLWKGACFDLKRCPLLPWKDAPLLPWKVPFSTMKRSPLLSWKYALFDPEKEPFLTWKGTLCYHQKMPLETLKRCPLLPWKDAIFDLKRCPLLPWKDALGDPENEAFFTMKRCPWRPWKCAFFTMKRCPWRPWKWGLFYHEKVPLETLKMCPFLPWKGALGDPENVPFSTLKRCPYRPILILKWFLNKTERNGEFFFFVSFYLLKCVRARACVRVCVWERELLWHGRDGSDHLHVSYSDRTHGNTYHNLQPF